MEMTTCQQSSGQIQVIFGPMFSGKTTELIRRVKRFNIANHNCLIVKYAHDNRYEKDCVATHDRQTLQAVSSLKLMPLAERAAEFGVIGIDEGQFFPDIVTFCEDMANAGKIVIVAALDGTYERKGFNSILSLVPLAESVVKLNAVCMLCFKEASYTKRICSDTQLEVIGGSDKYMAVCRSCYLSSPSPKKSPRKLEVEEAHPVKRQIFGKSNKENCQVKVSA